jgi:GNAT superfamily N-acetyltransferase
MDSATSLKVVVMEATSTDAEAIAELLTAVAERLTRDFGRGHWSSAVSENGILCALRTSRVYVVRKRKRIVATLRLATKKPWAIDKSYFSDCQRPLYMTSMAVDPPLQRRGIGRATLEEVRHIAREWPADAIRLDAYDFPGGAGGFYAKCGFREMGRKTYRKTPLIYFELLL